jgi:hypothetical protein
VCGEVFRNVAEVREREACAGIRKRGFHEDKNWEGARRRLKGVRG